MDNEFAQSLYTRLEEATRPFNSVATVEVREGHSKFPTQNYKYVNVTYVVTMPDVGSPNGHLMGIVADIEVWATGPNLALAEDVAQAVCSALMGWNVNTVRQGTVRILRISREAIPEADPENVRLAHISLRATGRAYRRT